MDLDGNALLLSFAIGGIGFVCFSYGKRQGSILPMVAGLILLVYPYFVSSLVVMALIAVAVLAALALAVRFVD